MNKTVELVNLWASFEEKHPGAGIEDFCLYYLSKNREKNLTRQLFDGISPSNPRIVLLKLLDWIIRLHRIYANMALEDLNLKHFDEFMLLNAVAHLKSPRKTDAINFTMHELSTGLNLLADLRLRGYITEYDDPTDKRSKRLELTEEGDKLLKECYNEFSKVSQIIFYDMSPEDIDLCILLLRDIEIKFSGLWQHHKGRSIDEIHDEIIKENNSN
ncbi:MAG: winged helix-turn-helix transcriptional regulator [Ignavibacteria bacterium]|jgi:DNA-binding MarR family transcriptional regulator|nr:winged helix-turn-helix transcriptional regulator [Ignavibacteria bacterium]MCU7504593.1 winged helix-turn-helix transcriptional regulator [Ignavibacteria bacterium]MCU7516569.1 winged helix-turn-helix transcriptional regulator [Ignavibacteria bacterium]